MCPRASPSLGPYSPSLHHAFFRNIQTDHPPTGIDYPDPSEYFDLLELQAERANHGAKVSNMRSPLTQLAAIAGIMHHAVALPEPIVPIDTSLSDGEHSAPASPVPTPPGLYADILPVIPPTGESQDGQADGEFRELRDWKYFHLWPSHVVKSDVTPLAVTPTRPIDAPMTSCTTSSVRWTPKRFSTRSWATPPPPPHETPRASGPTGLLYLPTPPNKVNVIPTGTSSVASEDLFTTMRTPDDATVNEATTFRTVTMTN